MCMCVGARGLSGEKGWGDRAGGGQGKSQPGFALVFTTYWKCGPGNAAHVLCSVLSALVQTLQGPGLERVAFLFRDCQQLVSVWFSYSIRHSPEGSPADIQLLF